jgi:hypothetical protein
MEGILLERRSSQSPRNFHDGSEGLVLFLLPNPNDLLKRFSPLSDNL